jgi:hypothetical protein
VAIRILAILFALAWSIPPVVASEDAMAAEFRAREEAWCKAMQAQERAPLEAFLAKDYT